MTDNKVWFVGAGPGDPELITVKGMRLLERADLVIYTGSLVPEAVLQWAPRARCINSASLDLDRIFQLIKESFETGLCVVRLHTGEPSLYIAIFEQMVLLNKARIPYEIIPGVTAAFAAAAALKMEFTLPLLTQTLIFTRISGKTRVPETENLEQLAAHQASLAIYLSIAWIEKVQEILENAYGPDFLCAVAYRVSQPEEQVVKVCIKDLAKTVKAGQIKNHALIIVSKALNMEDACNPVFSNLYDKAFSHGFRH